jgi:hypothetical protein
MLPLSFLHHATFFQVLNPFSNKKPSGSLSDQSASISEKQNEFQLSPDNNRSHQQNRNSLPNVRERSQG